MSNQQRARLPPTPSNSITTTQSNVAQRHPQNIDVQNNSIATVVTTTDNSGGGHPYNNNNINDDSLNALGPDLALQTSKVLENLSIDERTIILDVLSRDESIRQRDSARIMLLRAELHNLKKRSALKTGSLDRPVIIDSNRSCARCRSDLGRILNRGAPCRACKLRVCKGCREFTNRTDWVCVVCHKQIELQNATGEWMNSEIIHTPPRRSSITQPGFIPTAEIIRKSISRSWTISNPEDDQLPNGKNGIDTRIVHPNLHSHEPSSYPNLIRLNKSPYNSNMDFNNPENYERTPPTQRRVLRQSTLPNPDSSLHSSCLKIPSPKQQMSPQYSPYHTDNENEPENEVPVPSPGQTRYQIRRQSTLPCKPNDSHTSKYLSTTSPNRSYSRSPDPSAVAEGEHGSNPPRYPPFVRQATFPCNNGSGTPVEYHQQRHLPTSPNRLSVNKSPDSGGESGGGGGAISPRRFMRQATLPNPDQHVKLLPTSPPKKSPQFIKRSPEFQRQNTISNPEGMSTLSVHGPKFLPISPRQKQNFLFPQPAPAPRTFLSQQHFPTMTEDQPLPSSSSAVQPPHPHSKMIKVRSHSNEEYSFNRTLPLLSQQEGRRLLPEIPNRARSPSRLVRQDHVKDEGEKRSPISKTFAEAKQDMYESQYTNEYSELNSTFAEADETLYVAEHEFESEQMSQPLQFVAEQTSQFHYESMKMTAHGVRTTEVYINDSPSEYFSPEDYIKQAQKNRNRRRKSRELPDLTLSCDEDSRKPKPEAMRSVSEDASPKTIKILPRRSFSQPEKETQKKSDSPQLPSPKVLGQRANSPKKEEGVDGVDEAQPAGPKKPVYRFPKMLEMRGDSKSFDAVVRQLIKTDNKDDDDKSQSMDDNLFSDKKENKTTLNEAEIQNAVEQAASLFKKVVLQRRKERNPVEDAEMTSTTAAKRYEDFFETEMKYPLDGEDYRLVFLSSDSSEKEEDEEDECDETSSTSSSLAIMFDDCDWDYFEPSITKPLAGKAVLANISPLDSPHLRRRRLNSSPLDSPVFCRRGTSESPLSLRKFRESDTGTDEEVLNFESSSVTSSEGFLPREYVKAWKRSHKCLTSKKSVCKCGKSTHYVAVPVPILVPMDTFQKWNSGHSPDLLQLLNTSNQLLAHQQEHKRNTTSDESTLTAAAAAESQYQQVMGEEKLPEKAKDDDDEEKEEERERKIGDVSITSNISCNANVTQARRKLSSPPLPAPPTYECDKGELSHRGALSRIKTSEKNNLPRVGNCVSSAAHLNETIKITSAHDTYASGCGGGVSAEPYTNSNSIKTASSCSSNALQGTSSSGNTTMISVGKLKIPEEGGGGGYLVSESAFSSTSENGESSCDDDIEKATTTKTAVQRSYDVAGAAQAENIVSDVDSSSNSATSGSELTDSEDTGIDEARRSKSKRFTKVFVVNKCEEEGEFSESDSNAAPSTTEEETSDIDNDTDGGIKLNYVRPLESDNSDRDSVSEQEVTLNCDSDDNVSENNVILSSIKTIDDNDVIDDEAHQHTGASGEQKVNGAASENVDDDDKNKTNSPSSGDECANQSGVIDEIVSNCDGLEQRCADPVDHFRASHPTEASVASCNLSMILGGGGGRAQTCDVKTGSADDENLFKIESPLNPAVEQQQQQQQHHDTTSPGSDSQTPSDSSVPCEAMETGLHQYMQSDEALAGDRCAAGSSNNNYTSTATQQQPSNSCMKQNVNEEIAKESLSTGVDSTVSRQRSNSADGNGKFTSLIMITQDNDSDFAMDTESQSQKVSVTTSDTTRIVTAGDSSSRDSIVVQHRNWQPRDLSSVKSKIGFYEENINKVKENLNVKVKSGPSSDKMMVIKVEKSESEMENRSENSDGDKESPQKSESGSDDVTVITDQKTLSAVIALEDGLADDDSWVEEMSQNDDEEFPSTETGSDFDSSDEMSLSYSGADREEELRGYNRVSIDFTLHTIVEESCEESEYEHSDRKSQRISASELEKYFFFGLGEGGGGGGNSGGAHANTINSALRITGEELDESPSETSSVCSEGLDSLNAPDSESVSGCGNLASSRLEKYFLTGFMGFQNDGNDNGSDGSGSVGSDSEGRPSPEQRRKKLVRARGTGRSHSSSLDNLLAKEDSLESGQGEHQPESDDSSETTCDDNIDKTEYHSDTVKRKKKMAKRQDSTEEGKRVVPEVEIKIPSENDEEERENEEDDEEEGEEGRKTPQPEFLMPASNNLVQSRKQHSRDSGFIGSNDDLLKSEKSDGQRSPEIRVELEEIQEEIKEMDQPASPSHTSTAAAASTTSNLMRKDSFNAWSSDEETNLMMSKMRQFFKSLIAANANTKNSRSSTPIESTTGTPKSSAQRQQRQRPPQLVYFENELTRLMKTVPGIKDEQVKEFVEYFSSEDAWSDSYDSSDYTSSDKESQVGKKSSSKIQQQISASCQEIIEKFDRTAKTKLDEEGDMGDGGVLEETAFVYQKLVASITKIADEKPASNVTNSPPIIAKVMHHIGSRLVALMHEVSSGESMKSNSPKQLRHHHHRRAQAKISATTTEDDGSTSESNVEDAAVNNLPRSKSHDLLLDGGKPAPDHMTTEEREASDYERFSWRGSFESALLTNCDSRNKLSTLDNSSSALSILAAKRRSAGDLLFTPKSLSREQLDRVRSCGSIGGDHDLENSKLWESTQSQESSRKRAGIIEDDTDESSDNDHQRLTTTRSTLPRSLQISTITASTTNSLPRLPTTSGNGNMQASSGAMQKAHSVYQFLQNNVKSARYRAPGFNRPQQPPKRALSVPGLQPPPFVARRDRRSKVQSLAADDQSAAEHTTLQVIGTGKSNGSSLTPTHPSPSSTADPWPAQSDEDIDRLVAMHQNRHNSLSSLGLRSDSMASVYSGAGEGRYGTVQVKGMVEFGMQYNYKQCALEIHVKQCKDLAAVDTKRNRSDPYVKVYLLPDKTKSGKRKTKVKKHTLNPVFDEVLRFYMSLSSLESRTLWLTVWHSDMFGRNDFLGEVMISLQNKVFDNPLPQWYQLEERSEPFEDVTTYRGDIIVGLKFIPGSDSGSSYSHGLSLRKFSIKSNSSSNSASNGSSAGATSSCSKNTKGSLHVLVKEAKHLSAVKANGNCDAFCKSYLLPDKNRSSKQKTQVIKRSTNPQWNYTFVYEDVTLAELSERALELTIWDHDRLASNEFLGGVRFSLGTGKHYGRSVEWNDANGKELTLWQSMINRPNFWVEGCLALRSSLENRTGT